LGVIGFSSIFRTGEPKGSYVAARAREDPNSEGKRWWRLVKKCEYELGDSLVRPIHVMDREADSYLLLSQLIERDCRFVIRAHHDRPLLDDDGSAFSTTSMCARKQAVLERSVAVSPRKTVGNQAKSHPSRRARIAKLRVTAKSLSILRSSIATKEAPSSLPINLVTVEEVDCPEGEPPVSWHLWTTEPIETVEDIAAIIDFYRSRWLIEEFFKALKTGCNYESKQLESAHSLLTMLGLYIPVACQILTLRTLSRGEEAELPATCIMTENSIAALRAADHGNFPAEPTVRDALAAVARLGGHIKGNGSPGWLVLWRGYQDFLMFEMGWNAAKRCDQS
jgi:hypothetical protein